MGREAKNIKLSEFFTLIYPQVCSVRLEIPEFQRNYVWGKDKIKELLDSIKESEEHYYIGNIVTIKSDLGTSGRDRVLDGQQRLVTLSLLCTAIYYSHHTLRPEIIDLIFENYPQNLRIKFLRETLDDVYSDIVKSNIIVSSGVDGSQKKIIEAYEYIKNSWLPQISNIDEFIRKLKSIEFVVIKCETDEDAFLLFEGLNSTGISLGAVELIKNSILSKAKSLDPTQLDSFIELWETIEIKFETIDKNAWFQKFIRHNFFGDYGYIGNSKLFKEIKAKKIDNATLTDLSEYLNSLELDSILYIDLRKSCYNFHALIGPMPGPDRSECAKILSNIQKFGLDQIYSVLMALIKYGLIETRYFRSSYKKDFKKLFSFLLIIKFTKVSPASYERIFARLCKEINGKSYSDFRNYIQNDFFPELTLLIDGTQDIFKNNFSENFYGNKYSESFCRMILLDIYSLPEETGTVLNTLEHIIPKNYSSWTYFVGSDKKVMEKEIWKIGNLSILEENLNGTNDDKEFIDKKTLGFDVSSLRDINTDLVTYDFSTIPLEAIKERSIFLAEKIYLYYYNFLNTST